MPAITFSIQRRQLSTFQVCLPSSFIFIEKTTQNESTKVGIVLIYQRILIKFDWCGIIFISSQKNCLSSSSIILPISYLRFPFSRERRKAQRLRASLCWQVKFEKIFPTSFWPWSLLSLICRYLVPQRLVKKNSLYRVGESEDFGEGITGFSGGAEGCKSLPTKYKGVTIENWRPMRGDRVNLLTQNPLTSPRR